MSRMKSKEIINEKSIDAINEIGNEEKFYIYYAKHQSQLQQVFGYHKAGTTEGSNYKGSLVKKCFIDRYDSTEQFSKLVEYLFENRCIQDCTVLLSSALDLSYLDFRILIENVSVESILEDEYQLSTYRKMVNSYFDHELFSAYAYEYLSENIT